MIIMQRNKVRASLCKESHPNWFASSIFGEGGVKSQPVRAKQSARGLFMGGSRLILFIIAVDLCFLEVYQEPLLKNRLF